MDTIKYEQALSELEAIATKLEDGNFDIDELSVKITRAKELIRLCKDKLKQTKDDISEIISDENEDN